jgi:hypothetical protein
MFVGAIAMPDRPVRMGAAMLVPARGVARRPITRTAVRTVHLSDLVLPFGTPPVVISTNALILGGASLGLLLLALMLRGRRRSSDDPVRARARRIARIAGEAARLEAA